MNLILNMIEIETQEINFVIVHSLLIIMGCVCDKKKRIEPMVEVNVIECAP